MNQTGFNIVFLSFDHETADLFGETTLFKNIEVSLGGGVKSCVTRVFYGDFESLSQVL